MATVEEIATVMIENVAYAVMVIATEIAAVILNLAALTATETA